jgi:ceroid-lipofuscinosis MFS transporter 7
MDGRVTITSTFDLYSCVYSISFSLFRFNMYTAPAYFMTIVTAFIIVIMLKYFKDRRRFQIAKNPSQRRVEINDFSNQMTSVGLTVYDCCIVGCMLLNVATKGSISSFETLGVSIAENQFDMLSGRAATIVASCGTIGVFALLSMGHLSNRFTDVQLICGGMGVMATGILSLIVLDEDGVNPSWRFCFAIFMIYSIGYPIGHTAVIGLFSKSKWTSNRLERCIFLHCQTDPLCLLQLWDDDLKEQCWVGLHRLDPWPGYAFPSCQVMCRST